MTQATEITPAILEKVLIQGDLSQLSPTQRLEYYLSLCRTLGLNPLRKPFAYINLGGKLTLYALKSATDELRRIHKISVTVVARERTADSYVVSVRATMPDGRTDESIGAVALNRSHKGNVTPLAGEDLANALMKAETKAKRRATLAICGLGMMDESEVASVPNAKEFSDVEQIQELFAEIKKAGITPNYEDLKQRFGDYRTNPRNAAALKDVLLGLLSQKTLPA